MKQKLNIESSLNQMKRVNQNPFNPNLKIQKPLRLKSELKSQNQRKRRRDMWQVRILKKPNEQKMISQQKKTNFRVLKSSFWK